MNAEPVATDIQFFSLTSRIGRLRYLAYGMGFSLLSIIPILLCVLLYMASPTLGGALAVVLYIALIVFGVGLGVRRLHDMDMSGWWLLLMLVPLANLVIAIMLYFKSGTIGENRFGPQPPPNSTWVIVGAWSFLLVPLLGGILAAIAIPAYQDFVARSQMAEAIQLTQGTGSAVAGYYQSNKKWPDDISQVDPNAGASEEAGRYTQNITGGGTADGGYAIVAAMKQENIMWAIRGKTMETWTTDNGATWHCGPGGPDPVAPRYLIGSCRESGAP